MAIEVSTLAERIELMDAVGDLDDASWPKFLAHGNFKSWGAFYDQLIDYSLVLTEANQVIAASFAAPIVWDGTLEQLPNSLEQIIQQGLTCHQHPGLANTLVPTANLIDPNFAGLGLSNLLLQEMKKMAVTLNFQSCIIPVRPTMKAKYPLQHIENYIKWRRKDGLLYDPWLRNHEKMGGTILKVAHNMLTVEGNLSDWGLWTELYFPESGQYVIPDACSPIEVNVTENKARYEEPYIWIQHTLK